MDLNTSDYGDGVVAGLKGVPETMLMTLYARAYYSKAHPNRFYDQKSIDIAAALNYDFSRAHNDIALQQLTISRTILIDNLVKDFIAEFPDATIVNIACGLDTRFFRVDNHKIRWYDIDLSESMDIRRRFIKDSERMSSIVSSAMDVLWAEKIGVKSNRTLVIVEGLSMYLEKEAVENIFHIISQHFRNTRVLLKIMPKAHVTENKYTSISDKAHFSWGIDSGSDLSLCNFIWIHDCNIRTDFHEIMNSKDEKIAIYEQV